jgi:hypothetical protein
LSTAATTRRASEDSTTHFPWKRKETVILPIRRSYTPFFGHQDWVEDSRRSTRRRTQAGTQGLLNDAILQAKGNTPSMAHQAEETKKGFSLWVSNLDSLLGKTNTASEKRTAGEAKLGVAPGELGRVLSCRLQRF